jgi:hypothetical protein
MLWMRRALEMEQDVALERGRLTWLCIPAILIYSMNFQNSSKIINHTDLFSIFFMSVTFCLSYPSPCCALILQD